MIEQVTEFPLEQLPDLARMIQPTDKLESTCDDEGPVVRVYQEAA